MRRTMMMPKPRERAEGNWIVERMLPQKETSYITRTSCLKKRRSIWNRK